jgi:dTDP-4-dehydrorhamnose 3,5-epimerase
MQRFKINKTCLLDLFFVDLKPLKDNRGYLKRLYCNDEFINIMGNKPISQINYTFTKKKGSLRGLHYQIKPFSEKKIITCIKGEVYDVAVDLRKNSSTFLKYFSIILSEKNNKMIIIPEGFAHGFQTLKDNSEMMYFHSKPFSSKSERGINSLEPKLNIKWPLKFTQISARDKNHSFLKLDFKGI